MLEIGDGVFDVKSTAGDNHLGGDNFDKAVVDWLVAEFKEGPGRRPAADEMALQRLYEAAGRRRSSCRPPRRRRSTSFITAEVGPKKHLDI